MRQAVLGSHVGSLICPISGFLGPWKASIAINGCESASKITKNCHKGRTALIRYTGRILGHTYPSESRLSLVRLLIYIRTHPP
jgi:hypothetical protein